MSKRKAGLLLGGAAVLAAGLVVLAATSTGTLGGPGQTGRQNIRGIRIDASSAQAALEVNQSGSGPAATFNGPVHFGAEVTGTLSTTRDLDGEDLVLDLDGDTRMGAAGDDVVRLTSGAATGLWNVLAGNLKVGNATPSLAQNGEDAYVEGMLEVDGPARFEGGIDMQEQAIVNVASLSMVDDIDAGGYLVLNIGAGGTDFRPGGGLTLADGLVVTSGGQSVAGLQKLPAAAPIVVTHGATFAATGSMQPISAASGPVTPVLSIPPAGTRLCLVNTGAVHIVLADTGNQVLAGNWDAGQYDVLCGWSDGTRFLEISRADN